MSAKKSSSNSRWHVLLVSSALAAGAGGCTDYTTRSDTVTLAAGDAQAWNKVIHTADPWPPYVMNTRISGDGQRTAGVIQRYSTGDAGSVTPAPVAGNAAAEAPTAE